ncbi:MAG TPA: glycerol-3-phosphate dehydrogenase/oxidase [Pirellulales bacterium]|nr:glycerol-3-phosphate dehydrogenase/oxidase [Pirellulales bacterium]
MPDRSASRPPPSQNSPVLILGAGINGAALAREFLLGGVPVVVVDKRDLAHGATAYSSRLIHGGLRYLEYGEFDLVRESLAERTRLLRLAPQFVQPLRLFIPVENRFGGLTGSAMKFLKVRRAEGSPAHRGLWLVRAGLALYDWQAQDGTLPRHETISPRDPQAPAVDSARYRWLCSYYDAQIRFPERFVVALFDDARRLAAEQGLPFQLLTYHHATRAGTAVAVVPEADGASPSAAPKPACTFQPAAIVNATGAWVDLTLQELHVPSSTLMGGTKGSHFVTWQGPLREALRGGGIYAEAADGRPVFILPLGSAVLVGTTDLPFSGDPAEAVASEDELLYLLDAVNRVLPEVRLTRADIDLHYSGVRPLPHVDATVTAAITRRHWLEEHDYAAVPVFSVIGGKLTTCRSLAESSVLAIRHRLGLGPPSRTSGDRPLPGCQGFPEDRASLEGVWNALAERSGIAAEQARAVWELCGTQAAQILAEIVPADRKIVTGTELPRGFVRWVIANEWVRTLDDLVERRLMLLYCRRLSHKTLRELATLLVEANLLAEDQMDAEVHRTVQRLRSHFGKRLDS